MIWLNITSARMNSVIPFVASLLICSVVCNSSADTPQIRVGIQAKIENGNDAQIVSALSREIRKLDGISVTDSQPAPKSLVSLSKATCRTSAPARKHIPIGYAASIAVLNGVDNRLILHFVQTGNTIEELAQAIAIEFDGTVIEPMRRAAQPSSSP